MSQMSLKLIVGLGNPDKHLLSTRHNVGFWLLDNLVEKLSKELSYIKKFDSDICELVHNSNQIYLMKPLSYVNNSGVPIKKYIKNKNIKPENILIVYDDLDLNVGQVRLKQGGGSAGHNGLNSIIEQLGSKEFWRLRIGIDKPANKDDVVNYVLGKPSPEDKQSILECINLTLDKINQFFDGDFSNLMNKLNGK
jgi:PTH1 family peptidyl-tRNA hydrolase